MSNYIGIWTFNENTTAKVEDYSEKDISSISTNNITIAAGDRSLAGSFNGVDSEVDFGDKGDVSGTKALTLFAKVNLTSLKAGQVAISRDSQYLLYVTGTGKVGFDLFVGGVFQTLLGATSIVASAYREIAATYDGVNMRVFLDGAEDGIVSETGTIGTDAGFTDVLRLGNFNDASFFDGKIEHAEARTNTLILKEIDSISKNTGGVKFLVPSGGLKAGDLIINPTSTTTEYVVTHIIDADNILAIPFGAGIFSAGEKVLSIGNRFDPQRQIIIKSEIANGNLGGGQSVRVVKDFPDFTDPTKNVLDIGQQGVKVRSVVLTADFTFGNTVRSVIANTNAGAFTGFLPLVPVADEEYQVCRNGGGNPGNKFTLDGNGININGSPTLVLLATYDSHTVKYNSVDDEWIIKT